MIQKVNLTISGQPKQIKATYNTEESTLNELEARLQAFVTALQPDDLLLRIAQRVVEWVPEFEGNLSVQTLLGELQFKRLDFDDDGVATFLVAPITFTESTIICSLSYTHPPEIQDFGMFAMNLDEIAKRDALQAAVQARDLSQLRDFAAQYNLLPPPWVTLPHAHPVSIGWRMGYGESFIDLWSEWWDVRGYTEAEQVEYFREWKPPHAWLEWVIFVLWPDIEDAYFDALEEDEEAGRALLLPYFARLEALGFGSYADWKADYEREDWQ